MKGPFLLKPTMDGSSLSEEEFRILAKQLVMSEKSAAIAYGVLVQGRSRSSFVQEYNTSPSNVSRICKRVMDEALTLRAKRQGLVPVNVFLPPAQADAVVQMAEKYVRTLNTDNDKHKPS